MRLDPEVEALLKNTFEAGMLSADPDLASDPLCDLAVSAAWARWVMLAEVGAPTMEHVRLYRV